jgi:hypothetical protein
VTARARYPAVLALTNIRQSNRILMSIEPVFHQSRMNPCLSAWGLQWFEKNFYQL